MPLLHIAVVAIVQGLTEFLPISSSGHLILAWQVLEHSTGQPVPPEAQQLVMDIAVHVGTLGAVTAYLWREVWLILRGVGLAVRGRPSPGLRLLGLLVLATIPVIIAASGCPPISPRKGRSPSTGPVANAPPSWTCPPCASSR